ncbi:MAG: peptidylprolyl isomerase [bacterium]|nr:peptidylprolyl isomerase [bacterium]
MMQTMRQNMKVILWILVLAFIATIIFSWGMGGFTGSGPKQGVVAVIDGTDIPVDRLESLIQQRLTFEQSQQNGAELSEFRIKQLRQEVWDELIRNTLIEREVKSSGIKVSDKEIAFLVQNSPPDFIKQNEYFQKDSTFDMAKYQEFLRNPAAAQDLMMLEDSYRKSLPSQKFLYQIMSLANVSDQEVWEKYLHTTVAAKARYVLFATADSRVDSFSISPKDVQNYYNENKEDYRVPEKRRILYTIFKEEASKTDSSAALETANELMTRIGTGEDFGDLAKQFSDDRTAENGGDLGFFERGRMVPEFDRAAFSTPVGQVTGPVATKFGYHLIKVTDKKMENGVEQISASHILLKVQPSADTKDQIHSTAEGYLDEIKQSTMSAAAAAYKVKIDTSGFFERRDFIPGVGRLPSAVEYIFNRPIGDRGPIYRLRDGLLVFEIYQVEKEKIAPLPEVQTQITAKLLEEKNLARARERCETFYRTVPDAGQFVSRAEAAGLKVETVDRQFRSGEFLQTIGQDQAFISTALANREGGVSKPVKGMNGYYLIQTFEKTPVDSADFQSRKANLRGELMSAKQNQLYNQWFEDAKKKATIQDHRYLYYLDY